MDKVFILEDMAKAMFEAYNTEAGGKTWDGKDIPPWDAVGEKVQNNWRAAAYAAETYLDTHTGKS